MNRFKTKHCVLHNGMKTWNSLPDIFKITVSFSTLKSTKFLSTEILENIDAGPFCPSMIAFFSDTYATAVFQV